MQQDSAPEIIRGALKTPQLQRLLSSVFARQFPALLFSLDATDIGRSVAGVINPRLGDKKLTYFDVVGLGKDVCPGDAGCARRILTSGHQAAALISFDVPIQLSGKITIQPGDIAIYKSVPREVVAFVGKDVVSARILRYYHTSDQPTLPPELMAAVAQTMAPQDIINLCSSAKTFDAKLCKNESTLMLLWKTNISERIPLTDQSILALPQEARVNAMLNRYLKALKLRAGDSSDIAQYGYEKLLAKYWGSYNYHNKLYALLGAAKGGHLQLFKDLLLLIPQPLDEFNVKGIIDNAISGGNIEMLKFLESTFGVVYTPESLLSAAYSNVDMYKYVENKLALANEKYKSRLGRDLTTKILHNAISSGNVDLAKYLWDQIRTGSNSYKVPESIPSIVAKTGNLPMLRFIGDNLPYDEGAFTGIINDTIDSGNLDALKYVVSKSYDMASILRSSYTDDSHRVVTPGSYNPVLHAIGLGRIDMVTFLLQTSKLPLNAAIKRAYVKAFINAAMSGNIDMFKYLSAQGLDYKMLKQKDIDMMLVNADAGGHLDMVKYLTSIFKYDPLYLRKVASRSDYPPISEFLRTRAGV